MFRIGEIFCGAGGIGYGLSSLCEVEWAIDSDKDACETYAKNVSPNVICQNVKEVDFSRLPAVDGITFGFPCNDFSVVGKQKGTDGKFGGLYKYAVEAVRYHRPLWFVAENVTGIQSANEGEAFRKILEDLSEGYRVCWNEYHFEDYGVPQSRHRIVIVGYRDDLGREFQVPQKNMTAATCKQALTTPPIDSNATNNERTKQSAIVQERLSHIKPGENIWQTELPPHLRLNVKGAKMSHIYRRLDPNKPSYTLTASGGGGTHVYHWEENRALTNRERARLQTFPDDFVFCGKKESVRKQIGMAVPPLFAKAIGLQIQKDLQDLTTQE